MSGTDTNFYGSGHKNSWIFEDYLTSGKINAEEIMFMCTRIIKYLLFYLLAHIALTTNL